MASIEVLLSEFTTFISEKFINEEFNYKEDEMKLLIQILDDIKYILNSNPLINLLTNEYNNFEYLLKYSYLLKYYLYKYNLYKLLDEEIKKFINNSIKIFI